MMNKMNKKVYGWEVYEDNAGVLHLFVFGEHGDTLYYHYGYEQEKGSLSADIEALESGDDPTLWDGNEKNDCDNYNIYGLGRCIVARYRCDKYPEYYYEDMGTSGHYEFDIW